MVLSVLSSKFYAVYFVNPALLTPSIFSFFIHQCFDFKIRQPYYIYFKKTSHFVIPNFPAGLGSRAFRHVKPQYLTRLDDFKTFSKRELAKFGSVLDYYYRRLTRDAEPCITESLFCREVSLLQYLFPF